MSAGVHNLPMLNARSDWIDWYNSIEDLAERNDVWGYCDPLGVEKLVFTSMRPLDSASIKGSNMERKLSFRESPYGPH